MERFVDLCDTFHLPVVNFVDNPGFLVGTEAEKRGTIRKGVRALTRRLPGDGALVLDHRPQGLRRGGRRPLEPHAIGSMRYAWPSGEWGSLPIEGGVEAAYKRVIAASDDPDATRRELESKLESLRDPILTAEAFGVEELIDPRETRPLLVEWARRAYEILEASPRGPKGRGMRP